MHEKYLSIGEVRQIVGLSVSTIRRGVDAGTFPRPVKVSKRCIRWRLSEVEAHLAAAPRSGPPDSPLNGKETRKARAAG